MIENNDVVGFSTVFEAYGNDVEDVKQRFLKAKIFDGRSF